MKKNYTKNRHVQVKQNMHSLWLYVCRRLWSDDKGTLWVHTQYISPYLYYFASTNRTKIDIQKYFKIPFTWKNCVALSVKRRQHSGILKILKNPFMVLQKNISNYAKINNLHVQVQQNMHSLWHNVSRWLQPNVTQILFWTYLVLC